MLSYFVIFVIFPIVLFFIYKGYNHIYGLFYDYPNNNNIGPNFKEMFFEGGIMLVLGFIAFVITHEPTKELVGINILTYHITTYILCMVRQAEAIMPLDIVLATSLILFGGGIVYLWTVIKRLGI